MDCFADESSPDGATARRHGSVIESAGNCSQACSGDYSIWPGSEISLDFPSGIIPAGLGCGTDGLLKSALPLPAARVSDPEVRGRHVPVETDLPQEQLEACLAWTHVRGEWSVFSYELALPFMRAPNMAGRPEWKSTHVCLSHCTAPLLLTATLVGGARGANAALFLPSPFLSLTRSKTQQQVDVEENEGSDISDPSGRKSTCAGAEQKPPPRTLLCFANANRISSPKSLGRVLLLRTEYILIRRSGAGEVHCRPVGSPPTTWTAGSRNVDGQG